MDISIIIVNYNTSEHLKKCLESILDLLKDISFEIIVIDNNSTERYIEQFPVMFPSVKFIFRNTNDGFGAGCNFGVNNASGKYLLFINPDVFLIDDCLSEICTYMEKDDSIGVVSPLYLDSNNQLCYTYNNFPGIKWQFYESIGYGTSRTINKLLSRDEIKKDIPFEVDWVMGSFVFIRSDVFKKVQGFDENFFLYAEDVDLQYKVKKLGYKIVCNPKWRVVHYKRSSVRTYHGENLYYFHMARSNLYYMYKHYGFIKRNFSRFLQIYGVLMRMFFLPFRLKFRTKKYQKFEQYKMILKVYSMNINKLHDAKYLNLENLMSNKAQIAVNDDFWGISNN